MSGAGYRAVFGLPLYNAPEHLAEALDSLLAQTRTDFAVVLVDDSSDESVATIARRYAATDSRVVYERNAERLGLTRNWRRAFERATQVAPDAEFFAWGSDHDWWHPRWLEALTAQLDAHPEAAMAFPMSSRLVSDSIDWRSRPCRRPASLGSTEGVTSSRELARTLRRSIHAGTAVYGLYRTEAVRRAGAFRHVLLADRLVLAEIAEQGPILGVDETLWLRRVTTPFDMGRQRRACFPEGEPWYAGLVWWLPHAAAIAWYQGARRLRPRGIAAGAAYAWECVTGDLERRLGTSVKQLRRASRVRTEPGR
ncbi:MAG: glycosyltransferase family 2 protein [Solirubrobacteraceae bacterium]